MTTTRCNLLVESSDGLVVQLPLEPGHYRIGKEPGADFALGALAGSLEVTADSVSGTLDGAPVTIGETSQAIGGLEVRVSRQGPNARRTHSMPGQAAPEIEPMTLVDTRGKSAPRTIAGGELRIGSDEACDFRPRSDFISQFHCVLFAKKQRWHLRDLGSKNGTFLNEVRVTDAVINLPAVLRVGDVSLSLEKPEPEAFGVNNTGIIGKSAGIREVHAKIEKFAPTRAPVLITGDSGTGKELVARAIHDSSARHLKPFITLNCGACSANLIESELFGHAKGAFTGASERRQGAFASADEGTLFLDEIGELPLELQPKLLRVLETQQIKAVGEDKTRTVNVRVIAATHRDLRAAIKRGLFREDLYHRLSVLTVDVPALSERGDDVMLLVEHFMGEMAPEGEMVKLAPDAEAALKAHRFSGNVRELRNALARGMLLRKGNVITVADLSLVEDTPEEAAPVVAAAPAAPLPSSISDAERLTIVRVLRDCHGSRVAAAKRLGIARSTLYRKLDEYDIKESELY